MPVLSLVLLLGMPSPSGAFPAAAAQAPQPDSATTPCALRILATAPAPPQRRNCSQGQDTTALGWRLIDYGVATLKYVVGLVLIMLGGLLVGMGWVVSLIEALLC